MDKLTSAQRSDLGKKAAQSRWGTTPDLSSGTSTSTSTSSARPTTKRQGLLLAATVDATPSVRVYLEHANDAARLATMTKCSVRIDGVVHMELGAVFEPDADDGSPQGPAPRHEGNKPRKTRNKSKYASATSPTMLEKVMGFMRAHAGERMRTDDVVAGVEVPVTKKPTIASALNRLVNTGDLQRKEVGSFVFPVADEEEQAQRTC